MCVAAFLYNSATKTIIIFLCSFVGVDDVIDDDYYVVVDEEDAFKLKWGICVIFFLKKNR